MAKRSAKDDRIKDLERQLAEKDRLIADLVKRHLESPEHALEQALRKWMTAALKGRIEVTATSKRKKKQN